MPPSATDQVGLLRLPYPTPTNPEAAIVHARNLALIEECVDIAASIENHSLHIVLDTPSDYTRSVILSGKDFNYYSTVLASYYNVATKSSVRKNNHNFDVVILTPVLGSIDPEIDFEGIVGVKYTHITSTYKIEGAGEIALMSDESTTPPVAVKTSAEEQDAQNYDVSCVGGTFDHLHNGHKVLLTISAQAAQKRTVIGVSGDALLVNKKFAEQLQPYLTRVAIVRSFCEQVNKNIECDICELHDMYGPAVVDKDVKVLVASVETANGAHMVAAERVKRGLNAIDVIIVSLVAEDEDGASAKPATQHSGSLIVKEIDFCYTRSTSGVKVNCFIKMGSVKFQPSELHAEKILSCNQADSIRREISEDVEVHEFQPSITINEGHVMPKQVRKNVKRRLTEANITPFNLPKLTRMGWYNRIMYSLRVNGRLWTWIAFHAIATLCVFSMFFVEKWKFLDDTLPTTAPNYWPKKLIPCFEFGAMHSLLFQMALLPLSMCKYLITVLRSTRFKRLVPFDYFVRAHIYLGYQMGIQLVVAFIVFVLFFGTLCAKHKKYDFPPRYKCECTTCFRDTSKAGTEPVDFCAKFGDEIMITGYVILVIYLTMLFTSVPFLAKSLKSYERFYYTHHLFIVMYFLTILHTFDDKAREGQDRSQSWKWFIFPMIIYTIDRMLYIATRKKSRILGAQLFNSPKTIILTVQKPQGFGFRAGQYLFLNVPAISKLEMHPFSIGSTNEDRYIKLFVTVYEDGWTGKLWRHLHDMATVPEKMTNKPQNDIIIMGPYGAPLQDVSVFDHVMLVCSGSGIVPMLSQLQQIISDYKTYREFRPKCSSHDSLTSQGLRRSRIVDLGIGSASSKCETLACRLDWVRNSNLYNVFMWLVMLINFTFIALPFTWSTNNLYDDFQLISCYEFLGVMAIYIFDFALRTFITYHIPKAHTEDKLQQKKFHSWQVIELMFVVCLVCMGIPAMVITKQANAPTAGTLFLWCLATCRTGMLIGLMFNNYITCAPNPAKNDSFGRGGSIQAISLFWVCRSSSQLSWLINELAEVQTQCDELFGEQFLVITAYATGTNIEEDTIKTLVKGSSLEDRVLLKRPDWDKVLTSVCEDVNRIGGPCNVGVLSCSSGKITDELANMCIKYTNAYKERPILCFVDGGEHTVTIQYNTRRKLEITFDYNDTTKTNFGQSGLKSQYPFRDEVV
eukprot:CFRG4739T1